MTKRHRLDELTAGEREQLELLKRAFELVREHRGELSRNAVNNTNPIHALVELVQGKFLDKREFERLLGKGSFQRWVLGRQAPEDKEALNHLKHLKKVLLEEMWRDVDEGKRPHPLDVLGGRK